MMHQLVIHYPIFDYKEVELRKNMKDQYNACFTLHCIRGLRLILGESETFIVLQLNDGNLMSTVCQHTLEAISISLQGKLSFS